MEVLIYKGPDAQPEWRHVMSGGAITGWRLLVVKITFEDVANPFFEEYFKEVIKPHLVPQRLNSMDEL